MADGTHPPALKELTLQLDRHLKTDLKGVPVCRAGTVQIDGPGFAACREAIVGRGRLATEIAFPEQPVIHQTDELVAYNAGTRDGVTSLILRAIVTIPTPAAIIGHMGIKPIDARRYGAEATITIPKIAGGSGSVTYLGLTFRKGIFSATCRDERLQFGFEALFADGTQQAGSMVRFCTSTS